MRLIWGTARPCLHGARTPSSAVPFAIAATPVALVLAWALCRHPAAIVVLVVAIVVGSGPPCRLRAPPCRLLPARLPALVGSLHRPSESRPGLRTV